MKTLCQSHRVLVRVRLRWPGVTVTEKAENPSPFSICHRLPFSLHARARVFVSKSLISDFSDEKTMKNL